MNSSGSTPVLIRTFFTVDLLLVLCHRAAVRSPNPFLCVLIGREVPTDVLSSLKQINGNLNQITSWLSTT